MHNAPCYPGTNIPIRVGDEILFAGDNPGTIAFVISTDEWRTDFVPQKDWFIREFGQGIMIESQKYGLSLEPEDETADISLVRRQAESANRLGGI